VAVAFVKANKEALITGLQAYTPARESDHVYLTEILYDLQKGNFEDATFRIDNASGKWTTPVAC